MLLAGRQEVADVEFVVPNAQVTSTKTFRQGNQGNQRPEPYAVSIGSTRVRRVSPFAVHAEFQVGRGSVSVLLLHNICVGEQHFVGVGALLSWTITHFCW